MVGHLRRLGIALEFESELIPTLSPFLEVKNLRWLLSTATGALVPLLEPLV